LVITKHFIIFIAISLSACISGELCPQHDTFTQHDHCISGCSDTWQHSPWWSSRAGIVCLVKSRGNDERIDFHERLWTSCQDRTPVQVGEVCWPITQFWVVCSYGKLWRSEAFMNHDWSFLDKLVYRLFSISWSWCI
jgi:hypothetical protein